MYHTSILEVQHFQIRLHNEDNEVVWCEKNEYDHRAIMYSIICENQIAQ